MKGRGFLSVRVALVTMFNLPACSGPSGAGYDGVGIRVQLLNDDGATIHTTDHCFTLPLLLGSRIEQTFEVGPGYSLFASATRDEVTFTGEGVTAGDDVELTFDDFESTWSQTLDLVTTDGADYRVTLKNGCGFTE